MSLSNDNTFLLIFHNLIYVTYHVHGMAYITWLHLRFILRYLTTLVEIIENKFIVSLIHVQGRAKLVA